MDAVPERMQVAVVDATLKLKLMLVVDVTLKLKWMLVVGLALELMPVVVAGAGASPPRRRVRKTRSRTIAGVDIRPTVNRRRP